MKGLCLYCEVEEAWEGHDGQLRHAGGVLCERARYVEFREASSKCGMSNQYCSEYIDGLRRKPALGEGLRFHNWPNASGNYHGILIHRDDVASFVERVQAHRREIGQI